MPMCTLDQIVAACLAPLAVLTLISGLDDLVLDLALLASWLHGKSFEKQPSAGDGSADLAEKSIAIFVPLWNEHEVIARMLEHNLSAIRYRDYEFFVGVYPNDLPTLEAARALEQRFLKVHLAVCPHEGPTSKGDCLNWIYQRMLLYEEEHGVQFEVVATHDAEDLIHSEALALINQYSSDYDMVQIPVLPLPTPFRDLTHGVYCDEFAEFQTKDAQVRRMLGGFVPSNGVGTGYSRRAVEKLAETSSNRVFEPGCLTEDYENGLRLHCLGFRQIFLPIRFLDGNPVATREYFPQCFRHAVRQRIRWVTGISLQTWERYGWRGKLGVVYWFWRDRKGLLGNPASIAGNAVFLYGLSTWLQSQLLHTPWGLKSAVLSPRLAELLVFTLLLQFLRTAMRMGCVARIYGWRFSLGVPLRAVWANWINSLSTVFAVCQYASARARAKPLVWLKTEHFYPSRQALMAHKRRLGEVLVGSQYLSQEDLEAALASQPPGVRLGEHLVRLGKLKEEDLYGALSLQQNLPASRLQPPNIRREMARALPARMVARWRLLPFRISGGCLFLAGPELPSDEVERKIRRFTNLEVRLQLITPGDFDRLRRELL